MGRHHLVVHHWGSEGVGDGDDEDAEDHEERGEEDFGHLCFISLFGLFFENKSEVGKELAFPW